MGEKKYDVSISHAYGDKDSFLNELALALQEEGNRIWYTGFDIRTGESIVKHVKRALEESRYGILIISPVYFEKQWTMTELDSLLSANRSGRIIPVLHNIAARQLAKLFPAFTHKLPISSAQGIAQVMKRILKLVKSRDTLSVLKKVQQGKESKFPDKRRAEGMGVIVLGGNVSSKNMIGSEMPRKRKRARATEEQ